MEKDSGETTGFVNLNTTNFASYIKDFTDASKKLETVGDTIKIGNEKLIGSWVGKSSEKFSVNAAVLTTQLMDLIEDLKDLGATIGKMETSYEEVDSSAATLLTI